MASWGGTPSEGKVRPWRTHSQHEEHSVLSSCISQCRSKHDARSCVTSTLNNSGNTLTWLFLVQNQLNRVWHSFGVDLRFNIMLTSEWSISNRCLPQCHPLKNKAIKLEETFAHWHLEVLVTLQGFVVLPREEMVFIFCLRNFHRDSCHFRGMVSQIFGESVGLSYKWRDKWFPKIFEKVDYSKIRLTSHLYPLQNTSKTMVHHQLSWVVNHQFVRWPFRKTVLGFTGCSHWQLLVENSCAYAKIKQHIMYLYIILYVYIYMCIFISNIQNVNHCLGPLFTRDLINHFQLDFLWSCWESSIGPLWASSRVVAGHGCLAGVSHTWQQRWLHFHMTIHYIDLHQEELKRATVDKLGFVYLIIIKDNIYRIQQYYRRYLTISNSSQLAACLRVIQHIGSPQRLRWVGGVPCRWWSDLHSSQCHYNHTEVPLDKSTNSYTMMKLWTDSSVVCLCLRRTFHHPIYPIHDMPLLISKVLQPQI